MSKVSPSQVKQLLNEIRQAAGRVPATNNRARRRRRARAAKRNVNSLPPSLATQFGTMGMGSEGVAAAYSRRIVSQNPQIMRQGNKSFRVKHRELVTSSINAFTSFTVTSVLQINPGIAATFPWLAPQANQWEQYICHKLDLIYVPIVATSFAGDVFLSPEYDSSEPTPTTEAQISDNADTVVDNVWKSIVCCLDPEAMNGIGPRHYVRPCAIAGDIKTFDVAKIFVATNNASSNNTPCGKLYIEYDFEFFKPQNSPSPDTYPQQTSYFTAANTSLTTATATVVNWTTAYDPLNIATVTSSSPSYTPPAGTYRVEATVTVSDTSDETFSGTISIYKNGALFGYAVNEWISAGIANNLINVSVFAVVPLNGTDTLSVVVDATGAAGTLSVPAHTSQLVISLA